MGATDSREMRWGQMSARCSQRDIFLFYVLQGLSKLFYVFCYPKGYN